MLQKCMRATFEDVSTLGIFMGDTNTECQYIPEHVIKSGSIGVVQDCDFHPKKPGWILGKNTKVTGDYVFAGDARTTEIECQPKPVGLDNQHVAILAKVTYEGQPATNALTLGEKVDHDIQPQDVAQAEGLLRRLHDEEADLPHEQEPSDGPMAKLSEQQHFERTLLRLLHVCDGLPSTPFAANAEEARRLWQTHRDTAQQLRVRIRQHADEQAEAGGGWG